MPIDAVTDINEDTDWDKEAVAVNLVQIRNLPITSKKIVLATKRDVVLQKLAHYIVTGWPNANEISPELLPYYARRDAFTIEEGCILQGIWVVIPSELYGEILGELHESNPVIVQMKSLARLHVWKHIHIGNIFILILQGLFWVKCF